MKIAGIIAEYNPFHRGHAWHVRQTRRLTGCDYVIVCMSGHFTQRGEPTPWSKWARTRMALACGVDAVFELPTLYAVRTADAFARGGVDILGGLGADWLSFGSETEDMALLRDMASLRGDEPAALSVRIRDKLDEGMSHARARGEAVAEALGLPFEAVNRPNMILAAEYVRAIDARRFEMRPVAVRRAGDYHSQALEGLASASAIRTALANGDADGALAAMPEAARPFAEPETLHPMDDMLLYRLRSMAPEQLAALPDVAEGLEHRLYAACREASGREALLDVLKCKRYTRARLSRMLTHALLGMDRALVEAYPTPRYARLLGASDAAGPLLTELKGRSAIPIVTRAADRLDGAAGQASTGDRPMLPETGEKRLRDDAIFDLECRATDIWSLLHDHPAQRAAGREFRERFVR